MKKVFLILFFYPSLLFSGSIVYNFPPVVKAQYLFTGRSFSTSIWNTGVFNQTLSLSEEIVPGFQWPENSGKFLCLSAGLSVASYVNGQLRMASASYNGEWAPGYVLNGTGFPIPKTSESYHLYRVSRGDNAQNNPDYANWGNMVQRDAPYNDVNFNQMFDEGIDIPGVKGAFQTIFVCLTDGFSENHTSNEGFGGGTSPLFAELRFSAWSYEENDFEDIQFFKFRIINKNVSPWTKTFISLFYQPQIGDSLDDYVGCDTSRRLGYGYNRDNEDGTGLGNSYGANPPAIGMRLVKTPHNNYGLSSFNTVNGSQFEPGPFCEQLPATPLEVYNLMRGYKKDNTPWLNPTYAPPGQTKHIFSGDPETNTGWTEYNGVIENCSGALTGPIVQSQVANRIFMMTNGNDNYSIEVNGFLDLYFAQITARGSNNKNSVTQLKFLSDRAQRFADNNFTIGINPISSIIPEKFSLHQNYPNPFNPSTNIKFEIPKSDFVKLSVYDLSGKMVVALVNENLSAGIYEVNFLPENLSSGIYFYKLQLSSFRETKKMILIK